MSEESKRSVVYEEMGKKENGLEKVKEDMREEEKGEEE